MNKSHLKLEFYLLLVPAAATLKCASGCGDVVKLLIIHVALAEPQQAKVSVILDLKFIFFLSLHLLDVRRSQPLYFFVFRFEKSFLSELSCTLFLPQLQFNEKLYRPEQN